MIGYKTIPIANIMLTSAKELYLHIEMEESVNELDAVKVVASSKNKALNTMATVSSRQFTVEETDRFAGSFGDISRMVVNYAGVSAISNQRNDIIIRGNNPMGLLWRLNGIDIPNPNHFGEAGSTGGAISIINNNVLRNSDFFTGAFPSEYGNALAGAFDLKLRTGNPEKREYTIQAGYNGFEAGLEGPFSNKSDATYLISYRLSTLQLVNMLGIPMGVVPQYQDLVFNINTPTRKGSFSVFGIGGLSAINIEESKKEDTEWTYKDAAQDVKTGSDMGVVGLQYNHRLSDKTFLSTHFATSGTRSTTTVDSTHRDDNNLYTIRYNELNETKYSISICLTSKLNKKNTIKTGFIADHFTPNYIIEESNDAGQSMIATINTRESFQLMRAYSQLKHSFSDYLQAIAGIHYQYFTYNGSNIAEPRAGLKWRINEKGTFNIGSGLHSQLQPHFIYFEETTLPDGSRIKTNKDLDFSKSIHYVIGYDHLLGRSLRLKVETYYQSIYDVPVKEGMPYFSMLNAGSNYSIEREDSLVNAGTGKNYGVEFTFEKFFETNYYYLLTLSLYESKYKGYNGVEKNTAFNGNFSINALGGYEFKIGNNNVLGIDFLALWAGGRRYVPFIIYNDPYYRYELDWENAYMERLKDYFSMNVRLSFTLNRPKFNVCWSMDFQNITNHKNIFMQRFDPTSGEVKTEYQLGFIPVGKIKFEF